MKTIIFAAVFLLAFTACNPQGQKRTKTVKAVPAKRELIVEKQSLTNSTVPEQVQPEKQTVKLQPLKVTHGNTIGCVEYPGGPAGNTEPEDKVYEFVEERADYPGGMAAFYKFFAASLVYPESAIKAGIEGKAYVKIIVRKNGSAENVTIVKKVNGCPECDREALRIVKSVKEWIPAKIQGKSVDSYFTFPIQFNLQ